MTHDQWRLQVASTIGGSSAAASIGQSRFTSRRQLWEKMSAARRGELLPEKITDDMRRGQQQEPVARQQIAERFGVEVRPHDQQEFIRHDQYPWAHCLPDGWLPDGGVVEIKVPRPATMVRLSMHGIFEDWRIQAEHNATICAAPYTLLAIYEPVSTRLETFPVHPDEVFVETLMRGEQAFFESVLRGEPPEDDADQQTAPIEPGMVVLDTPEARAAADNLARLLALTDEAEELLDEAKRKLAILSGCEIGDGGALIGGPESFEVPGLIRVHHRLTKPVRRFDKDAAIKAYPDLAGDAFHKLGKPSRPFRTYLLNRGE